MDGGIVKCKDAKFLKHQIKKKLQLTRDILLGQLYVKEIKFYFGQSIIYIWVCSVLQLIIPEKYTDISKLANSVLQLADSFHDFSQASPFFCPVFHPPCSEVLNSLYHSLLVCL